MSEWNKLKLEEMMSDYTTDTSLSSVGSREVPLCRQEITGI